MSSSDIPPLASLTIVCFISCAPASAAANQLQPNMREITMRFIVMIKKLCKTFPHTHAIYSLVQS